VDRGNRAVRGRRKFPSSTSFLGRCSRILFCARVNAIFCYPLRFPHARYLLSFEDEGVCVDPMRNCVAKRMFL
jgi:hypothetical protein